MKTLFKASLIVSLFILTACEEKVTEPTEPPHVGSLDNIVINGKTYTAEEYWDEFCKDKFELHKTCGHIKMKISLNSQKRSIENWDNPEYWEKRAEEHRKSAED